MSQPPAEEESDLIAKGGQVIRTMGMAGMQMREAQERKGERAHRAAQQQQGEANRANENQFRSEAATATALHKEAYSPQFWKTASNEHLARSIMDSQNLAARGHGPANAAFMAYADQVRNQHGFNIESVLRADVSHEQNHGALLKALDDHNAAGRLRAEARTADHAAESVREEQQAQAEDRAAHPVELREAASREASQAGLDTDDYLDRLSDDQRSSLLADPSNTEARDARLESVETKESAGGDADATHGASHPQERHYDTAAETARDDADRATVAAKTNEAAAARDLPASQHNSDMRRHLETASKRDPQAAEARRSSAKNLPNDGRDYASRSVGSNARVRKTNQQQPSRAREHVQQR